MLPALLHSSQPGPGSGAGAVQICFFDHPPPCRPHSFGVTPPCSALYQIVSLQGSGYVDMSMNSTFTERNRISATASSGQTTETWTWSRRDHSLVRHSLYVFIFVFIFVFVFSWTWLLPRRDILPISIFLWPYTFLDGKTGWLFWLFGRIWSGPSRKPNCWTKLNLPDERPSLS